MRVYLFIAAIAGGATFLLTPLIRHLAIQIGAVGKVRARDVHTIPTPRMGGLAMMLGFAVAMLFASHIPFVSGLFQNNHQAWVVLAGAVAICLLGMGYRSSRCRSARCSRPRRRCRSRSRRS